MAIKGIYGKKAQKSTASPLGGRKLAKPNGDIVGGVNLGVQVDRLTKGKSNLQGKPDTTARPVSRLGAFGKATPMPKKKFSQHDFLMSGGVNTSPTGIIRKAKPTVLKKKAATAVPKKLR